MTLRSTTSSRLRRVPAAALAVAAGTAVLAGAAAVSASEPAATRAATKVTMLDDLGFSPSKLSVKRGTTLKWAAYPTNDDYHTVSLDRRPRGARMVDSGLIGRDRKMSFSRKLTVKGKYLFVCTRHNAMTQSVTVR